MTFQSILTPVATKCIAYRPGCTSYASFGLSTLFCPIINKVFDKLHSETVIMHYKDLTALVRMFNKWLNVFNMMQDEVTE